MASKVPKFGAWEGGDENYTVYFDKARDSKHSTGKKINPNDPEENPDMFRPNGGSAQARGDKQRKQTNVPQFGAWENQETIGFTQCFENVRKGKHGGPTPAENEPQMNRDMPSHPGPSGRTQTQAQSQAKALALAHAQALAEAQVKAQPRAPPTSREARPNVPRFGDWEGEAGGGYTVVFDNLKKKHNPYSNAPQPSRDVGPTPLEGRAKAPKFGDWEEGEAVQYTEYFNPRKTNNLRPGQNPAEPQMNRDVSQGPPVVSREGQGRPGLVPQATVHPKANLQPRTTDNRGNQAASIPHFGGWNNDPSQAEGYTGVFTRAKEERQTPVHHNVTPHHQPHLYNKQKQQPSCCTIL